MKLIKLVLFLAVLIALTKKGYLANPEWKPLTNEGDSADEDAAGSPYVKREALRSNCYDVRSPINPCVKEVHIEFYGDNKSYMRYECRSHSVQCASFRCENSTYSFIADLNKSVVSDCRCSKRRRSGRKLNLKRDFF